MLIVTLYFLCKGVNYGIRRLSEICFGSGIVLMLAVLLLDNTIFLLNLYVQSLGFYLQNLVKLGFHTDAFEQVGVFLPRVVVVILMNSLVRALVLLIGEGTQGIQMVHQTGCSPGRWVKHYQTPVDFQTQINRLSDLC